MANPVKIKCTVSSVIHHNDMVSTISLKPSRSLPNFQPGQFLHLALDDYDPAGGFWPESRVFSVASLPSAPEITIAYAAKGKFTRRMRKEIESGKELWIKLPYGHFTLSGNGENVVLIAGGTGITPFISFLLAEMNHPAPQTIKLFYGVRKSELFLFKDIIASFVDRLPDFQLYLFCEDGDSNDPNIVRGMLSLDAIYSRLPDPAATIFYLSGPAGLIDVFKKGLSGKGVQPRNIHMDEWE